MKWRRCFFPARLYSTVRFSFCGGSSPLYYTVLYTYYSNMIGLHYYVVTKYTNILLSRQALFATIIPDFSLLVYSWDTFCHLHCSNESTPPTTRMYTDSMINSLASGFFAPQGAPTCAILLLVVCLNFFSKKHDVNCYAHGEAYREMVMDDAVHVHVLVSWANWLILN